MVQDLATALAARGHRVSVLTSHRRRSTAAVEEGVRVERRWRPREGLPMLRRYEYHLVNVPNVAWGLARERFDVVHAFFLTDAWAAVRMRRFGAPPLIFSLNGLPTREYLVARRYRLEMLDAVLGAAARVAVLSDAAARLFRRYLLSDPVVLPPGVFAERFAAAGVSREGEPTLICAASLGDPRKRGPLLMAGFERLRERLPEARLVLVRSRDRVMSGAAPELPRGASWVDADRTEDLARAYASAWASVLPAVDEAFGLVLVESLAAGTPVVACRSGACPEIVTAPRLGRLFEPDDEVSLAGAMEEVLELAAEDAVSQACREHARAYDWGTGVERFESLYAEVLSECRRRC